MTVAPAVVAPTAAKPKPAITRDRYHRYTYQGTTYPGVTSILRVLDKSDALMAWASRNTAEAALAQLDHLAGLRDTVGPDGVIKALTARAGWKRDEAAAAGSDIHGMAERIARGEPLPDVPDVIRARVEAYAAWWAGIGLAHPARRGFRGASPPWATAAPSTCSPTTRPAGPSWPTSSPGRTSIQRWCSSSWRTGRPPSSRPRAAPSPTPCRPSSATSSSTSPTAVSASSTSRSTRTTGPPLRACLPLSRWHTAMKGQRL